VPQSAGYDEQHTTPGGSRTARHKDVLPALRAALRPHQWCLMVHPVATNAGRVDLTDARLRQRAACVSRSGFFSGLWSLSLRNGNISPSHQRLWGIFRVKWFEKGVQSQIKNQKSPLLAGLSATKEENSLKPRLVGWRRSADRTRLRANSLLTGNFTGNFAISRLPGPIS
jgi:hypothetical protein